MTKNTIDQQFPPGWDEARVQNVITHYEQQSEEEAVVEDEAHSAPINEFEKVIVTDLNSWLHESSSAPPTRRIT
jgi:hypothetical protein